MGPQRIICLTEETTEWLYLLGQEARIVGISGYTVRPRRAREEKPKVSAFLSAKIDKILALEPDCVFGFSDLQADIAAALIRAGVQVTVFNQRSVAQIFDMLFQVAAMVGQAEPGLAWIARTRARLAEIEQAACALPRRPRVYFEEWDDPCISGIRWVSELIGIAGGDDCFPELAAMPMGKDRIIGSFKLCLTVTGAISNVNMLKSTGFPAYDSKIQNKMRSEWRYKPYMVNGKAVPVCTAVTFIYSQK